MPLPNLLYRRLSETPGQLQTCWDRVRPGLLLVGAPRLKQRLLSTGSVPGTARRFLRDEEGRRLLFNVLDVYDAGNSCNAVLVHLLLNGASGTVASPLTHEPPVGPPPAVHALPPMLELDAMSAPVRERVERLARLMEPGGKIVPSVFRHLASNDLLLREVETVLQAVASSGVLESTYGEMRAAITRTACDWPVSIAPVQDSTIRAVIRPFAETIPRMLAASTILRSALAEDAQPNTPAGTH